MISDSTGFYINALFLLLLSALLASLWSWLDRQRSSYNTLNYFFTVGVRYYLCVQLLAYGLSKIFKWQFYLPEPNILYTPLGQLHRDILYWSSMGTSRTFSILTGSIEVMAGLLLLFRKTLLIGAFIALAVLLNVFMINISFDISVKLYSIFLLLFCCIIIAPYAKGLYYFLLQKNYLPVGSDILLSQRYKKPYLIIKTLLLLLIAADAFAPYIKSNNYNDDAATRPYLHGAYDVVLFIKNRDTLAPLLTDSARWRRVFIHRQGYFITQYMNDRMRDYELSYDTANKKLWINFPGDSVQHPLHYYLQDDSALQLNGNLNGDEFFIKMKKLDEKKLPALTPSFHWTIDE